MIEKRLNVQILEMVELKTYSKEGIEKKASFRKARSLAQKLLAELNSRETQKLISIANSPGSSSEAVQLAFLPAATELGFRDEARGLFANGKNQLLRPDYFKDLGNNEGILLEVERGKTTINNMDLLDMWKCHICPNANYLFLLVPQELRQNRKMKPRREFNTVSVRMASFFVPGNYTNVDAVFLFGY